MELHGNINYYVGRWCNNNSRFIGHGMYPQKLDDTPRLHQNNINFDNAEHNYSFHSGNFTNYTFTGNTTFGTGYMQIRPDDVISPTFNIAQRQDVRGLHLWANGPFTNTVNTNNYGYLRPLFGDLRDPLPTRGTDIGYQFDTGRCDETTIVSDNYSVGVGYKIQPNCERGISMNNNTTIAGFENGTWARLYPDNTYISKAEPENWPKTNKIFVENNKYEVGRSNVTIYNWADDDFVAVDLDQTELKPCQRYIVRDVQNFFGEPVARGIYNPGAEVQIPMRGLTKVQPHATATFRQDIPHTAPFFGVFVIIPDHR
jgi:hypothetical protein